MKVKADDYYNNGMFEIARVGNSIIQRNIMSEDEHTAFIDTLADNLPNTKAEINALIEKIRTNILKCDPIDILSFAQLQSLCSIKGITSESQQIGLEYVSIQRLTEYIQSVFISNPPCTPAEKDDQSELFFEISADYSTLYRLIQRYYFELGAKIQKENEIDEELQKNLFEAQMMYSVRGNRYQVFEHEYYEKLLLPHDEVFRSLFGLSAIDVVDGISKLQYALSQGRIDPFNHLGEMYNEFLDVDEDKREETIESQIEEGQQLISRFFGTELNDVCSVTGWPDAFVAELSYGLGDDLTFFEHPEYPGWPIINLPIQKRPFIRLNGKSYCFDYYSFIDNFYRSLQKMITRLDSSHKWNEIQKEASESMVENVFQKLLPGCVVYRNNYYPKEGSIKNLCENDLIILYYDVAIIVEVKAGSFVYTAPLVDYEQHIKSYKSLIEDPDFQCKRTYDYLVSNDVAILYDKDGKETERITVKTIEDYYLISVSVDNINVFAAKAEKISFLKAQCGAISLSIDDLTVYSHYFESPLRFLHFLKQRRAATTNHMIALNDELDHLGLYIEFNCYAMCFEDATEFSMLSLVGYREKLDTYFCELYHPKLRPQKPEQQLPDLYCKIIAFLDKADLPYKVRVSNYLLDFSHDARETLCNNIEGALLRQKRTGKALALSSAGRLANDLRYTCFVNQPGQEVASQSEQADYVMSTMLWNDESSRVLLCIEFDEENDICFFDYRQFNKNDIPPLRRDELFDQGKKRAEYRLAAHKKQFGNKVGRNEDCPCGSGKKYKRCCGR